MATSTMRPERIFVKVTSIFDSTGYMHIWKDGRVFKIESIKDFRPASSISKNLPGDCYTVIIKGEEKHLFFERTDPLFSGRVCRWFVESPRAVR